ncbi:MAG: hypothetical protein AAFV80_09170 [Bacteroidota bacterium]
MQKTWFHQPIPYFLMLCFVAISIDGLILESIQWLRLDRMWDRLEFMSTVIYGAGPAIAAWFTYLKFGSDPYQTIKSQLVQFPVATGWWWYALLIPLVFLGLPFGIELALSGQASPFGYFSWLVVVFAVIASVQEIGWRGFLLAYWLERTSPMEAALGR